ncbi:CTD kinase subunit alpha [Podosphaera aphanis]|nr:CTD kinase subunit alpha [Podosphaera aphanis]
MKDSWSHVDDRRDRGRVDRGAARSKTPRSPITQDSDRVAKIRDRSPLKLRPTSKLVDRSRERSHERRRRRSRSPIQDSREIVRERNRGRELLDPRSSHKPRRSTIYRSPSSNRRRKGSRSPSPSRGYEKKTRRSLSVSPQRLERRLGPTSRQERRKRSITPLSSRKRSPPGSPEHFDGTLKRHRESSSFNRRGRSPTPKARLSSRRDISRRRESSPRQVRSPHKPPHPTRDRSPTNTYKAKGYKYEDISSVRGRSPDIDKVDSSTFFRQSSPRAPRGPKTFRGGHSPRRGGRGGRSRDEFRSSVTQREPSFAGSGANSIAVKRSRTPVAASASGANSIEVKSDKMAGRGYYGSQQGYNPHHQMQAAFPLKPQYDQSPSQVNNRQYSQSPQHHLASGSFHGSPVQSPYSANRPAWSGHTPQHQYTPPPQYPQQYQQQHNYSNHNNQNHFFSQSPPYHSSLNQSSHPPHQQSFRGSRGGYRGNHYNSKGGRGDHRGGRVTHFKNLQWTSSMATANRQSQTTTTTTATPLHTSPQQQFPSQTIAARESTTQFNSQNTGTEKEEDAEELFRPSKDLQVEDKDESKKRDEEKMPPPGRPTLTGPKSQQSTSKFSFAFKGSSKIIAAAPKPDISSKLSAASSRNLQTSSADAQASVSRGSSGDTRSKTYRESGKTTRKVKKITRRKKEQPQLPEEFKKSESIYFRKPGNESVVGSGTYGKVFKAVHIYTRKLVALKKIRMEGERDGFPVTAVREIKLLQSLKHQNIVNLQEVMVEKNDCFMVFEYLSHDLTGLLNHPTFKLEPAHKKHLARQLFEGLDYLHRRGVLHRDIKAANILVSSGGLLKLADFGLARFYAKRRQLDYTNRVITIWYRSPELLLGETQYGPAVDIWSAACVLIEIFTRHAIFPGDGGEISQLEKIYAILGTPNKIDWPGLVEMAWFELLRPTARKPNIFAEKYKERVTPQAYELLQSMFQYDPAKRPSASDVLDHPYFTVEEPEAQQATELSKLDGDWHEFESKALRKENERKDKEARRHAQKNVDKKHGPEGEIADRDSKRPAIGSMMEPPDNKI